MREWVLSREPVGRVHSVYILCPEDHIQGRLEIRAKTEGRHWTDYDFDLPGYGPSGVDLHDRHLWDMMIQNPDGGLGQAKENLLGGIEGFLK